ncbi:glycosyltransferase [Bradyrhizobium canariense]|uniref:Glycosyl transferases group 1 n=1 Tax=Bradyrhizobium canariense TaxID=255045 RepID=A0A1H1M2S5_9BRAD|nr:glycosyltransferase [Bradyrhizobium canariense]SDR81046.1 Glycosyl transferases group 1 [Bradyrhizobium canariense]
MRLFQNARYYPSLRPRIRELTRHSSTYAGKIDAFVNFRESAAHILLPVDQRAEWAFFANGDDEDIQKVWAREQGMSSRSSLSDILKAQIEAHRADVFYNLDATGWPADFIKSLPGCVKKVIAWHAAPFRNVSFTAYDLVVCNFPSILAAIAEQGARTDYFFPAYDPEFAPFAAREDRPVDVVFVGGYSRHHLRRAEILEAVARLAGQYNIVYHLDRSRLCRLAESPIGRFLPLAKHRRPQAIRAITSEPTFGRDYYEVLSTAKIVLNGAIDMSGEDRGNMRCFEALGGGSLLLSDAGNYPRGMKDGQTLVTYNSADQAVALVRELLQDSAKRLGIARAGHEMVSTSYSKQLQWKRFEELVASI